MRWNSITQNHNQRSHEKGFISALILIAAAALSVFAIGVINVGETSIKVNMEKQVLDTHAVMVGKSLITRGQGLTCGGGTFSPEMLEDSTALFNALENSVEQPAASMAQNNREFECIPESDELIIREVDGPDGPAGSYRRYRIRSKVKASIFGGNDDDEVYTREVIVEVKEQNGQMDEVRPQIVFLLDYSGSMAGNRITQLRNAVSYFISQSYETDYGVIVYDSNVRKVIGIDASENGAHNNDVLNMVNNEAPSNSTNFGDPLIRGIDMLKARNDHQQLFVVLISDGQPNAGPDARQVVEQRVRSLDPEACLSGNSDDQCITVYTLGVDNADINLLESISGNASTNNNQRNEYTFIANANGTQGAFTEIVEDIVCKSGQLNPPPLPEEINTLHVFINGEALKVGEDFEYNSTANHIRFYDEACQEVATHGGELVIRYGQPRLIIEE